MPRAASIGQSRNGSTPAVTSKQTRNDEARTSLPSLPLQTRHPKPTTKPPDHKPVVDEHGITVISPTGDLVLDITHTAQSASFRVSIAALKQTSPYFRNLLDNSAYAESTIIATALAALSSEDTATVTSDRLPRLTIEDIGLISRVKSLSLLLNDYFRLLHDLPLSDSRPPLINLANLTVVADRFDTLAALRARVHSAHLLQIIDTRSAAVPRTTERLLQRLYIATKLDHRPWLGPITQTLIHTGQFQRYATDSTPLDDSSGNDNADESPPPAWHSLPQQLEAELRVRRAALVATLASLLRFLLDSYAGPNHRRQCKLGYDSSSACDAFQLGEAVRFLLRTGALDLGILRTDPTSSTAACDDVPWPNSAARGDDGAATGKDTSSRRGDLGALLAALRRCPNYQVDANHHHCGLRARLLPCLEDVAHALDAAGVCGECWAERRREHAWSLGVKGPLRWARGVDTALQQQRQRAQRAAAAGGRQSGVISGQTGDALGCAERHDAVRDLCLASERVWEPECPRGNPR